MNAITDSTPSLEAVEFLWNGPAPTPAHDYLFPTIRDWLKQAGAKTVLDLGCGNGALTAALHNEGFSMTGLDASESGIAVASRSFPDIAFAHSDLAAPLPAASRQRFDAVIAVEVIEHLLLPRQLFQRAKEALRHGGVFIVTTPYHGFLKNLALALSNKFDDHWHPLRDYGHVKFFSRATLEQLFSEQGFATGRFTRVGRVPALAKSMILQGTVAR
jgi:2-polyprenyl-6-hydroxyphenyl methylase/3-demethylubiquinone-9 3-methyltransferase